MKAKITKLYYKVKEIFKKHQAFVVVAIMLLITGFVIYRLFVLSNLEPSPDSIDDQTRSIQAIEFNEEAIEKIEELRDSNVKEPGTQVQEDRNNPFSE